MNLLRIVRNTALTLKERCISILQVTTNGLETYIKEIWNDANYCQFKRWKQADSPHQHLFLNECSINDNEKEIHTLQMNIITGSFLIDGHPLGRLPLNIVYHKDFQRIFGSVIFEVQPDCPNTYKTRYPYRSSHYSFHLSGELLIIKEMKGDASEYQLIPHHLFERHLPFYLHSNYSHWYCLKTGCIDFRTLQPEEVCNQVDNVHYTFTIGQMLKGTIEEIGTKRLLVNINSPSFATIKPIITRLEHEKYIHLMVEPVERKIIIDLPRITYKFNCVNDTIISNEHKGMCIAKRQKSYGSLVGLNHGLLLETVPPAKDNTNNNGGIGEGNYSGETTENREKLHELLNVQLLLLPHGSIIIKKERRHQSVKISLENLHSPKVFQIEIDTLLKQLKAGPSITAWLYLTYLHAITTSPLPDPFTGMSGAESALKLLQSARCWSYKPYNDRAVEILRNIAKISPKREYYPSHLKVMQKIQWPDCLYPGVSNDAYCIIVSKLIDDSTRLEVLYEKSDKSKTLEEIKEKELNHRAYVNSLNISSLDNRIIPGFLSEYATITSPKGVHLPFENQLNLSSASNLRKLAHYGSTWRIPYSSASNGMLTEFLFSGTTILSFESCPEQSVIAFLDIDLKTRWIALYDLARKSRTAEKFPFGG